MKWTESKDKLCIYEVLKNNVLCHEPHYPGRGQGWHKVADTFKLYNTLLKSSLGFDHVAH